MIRLGGHGIAIGSDDPVAFARAHRAFGYGAAYSPEVAVGDAPRLAAIEHAFAAEDVVLAEIGIWRNLITPDAAIRAANLAFACERLAIADAVGARCAVSYIGSFVSGSNHAPDARNLGPEAFDACVETARRIIDAVKPKRAKFALEMMQHTLPDGPGVYRQLIEAVDRPAFAAHLDPVNIVVSPRQYFATGRLIRECFELLGPWLVSCHGKDIVMRDQAALHFDEIIVGQGRLDYGVYLACLDRLEGVPLMLEHLPAAAYAAARDAVFASGDGCGIGFHGRRTGAGHARRLSQT